MAHFMSWETTSSKVVVQRFENFHPPPLQDADADDSWPLTGSHRQMLRFAEPEYDPVSRGCCGAKQDAVDAVRTQCDDCWWWRWRSANDIWRVCEVTLRRARLLLGWVTVFERTNYLGM